MALPRATIPRPQLQARAGVLVMIVLLGSLLRFAGLGRESIWLDEATSILIARMDLPSVVVWTAADIHPPLYYFALHFWLALGESEFAVRALSALAGVCAVVIVYALGRELFDPQAGLLSALLLALSPMHIWYSQEARMYAMVATLSLLASHFLVLALYRSAELGADSSAPPGRQTRYWLGYLAFSVLALYTHYYALFVLLFQNIFVLLWLWWHKASHKVSPQASPSSGQSSTGRQSSRLWRRWLLVELAIALLFLPWVPVMYRQVSGGGGGWVEKAIGRPTVRDLLDTWLHFSIGLDRQLYPRDLRRIAYALFAVCILAVAVSLFPSFRASLDSLRQWISRRFAAIAQRHDASTVSAPRPRSAQQIGSSAGRSTAAGPWGEGSLADKHRAGLWFCVLYVVVPLLAAWLVSQIKPLYADRYLVPFVPPYCILVAYGIRTFKWRWLQIGIALCLTLTLLVGNWNAWRTEQREDWRWATSYVLAHAQPGDVVLFLPRWLAKPFDYYARDRLALSMDLPVTVTAQDAQDVAAELARRYKRVWLVWQRGHYSDPDGVVKQVFDARFRFVEAVEFPQVGSMILYSLEAAQKGPD